LSEGSVPPPSRNPFTARRFPTWWIASMVAGTGVGIQSVTIPLFIRDRVDDETRALAIAAALVAQTLPGALLALVGGAIADRVERRRILATAYTIVAVVSIAYVALSGFDVRAVWPILPLAAIVGSVTAFTNPARQAMLPQIVAREQIQNGVIFGTMGFMAAFQFLGPTVAGFVADLNGLTAAFGLEVVLLFAAAGVFSRIRTEPPTPSGRSVLADLMEGLRYVRSEPTLRSVIALSTLPGVLFIGPFAVTVAIVVPDIYAASDRWVGIFWGCFGAGVFIGSVLLTVIRLPRRGLAVLLANISGGVFLVIYSQTETLQAATVALFFWGLGASIFINFVVALLQEYAQPQMIGRVMSMYSLAFFAAMPIGYTQAGLVTRFFDPTTTLLTSGIVAISVGILGILTMTRVRALR
jgi:MFS family permease